MHEFGHPVSRWVWDTVLAAHVLDNRQGIAGLKFQSFVTLGVPAYDESISEFLKASGNSRLNLVRQEVDLRQLLTYGGMDALATILVAREQRKAMRRIFG